MPAVMEQIDRMTTEEKFKTMDYIWSSLSVSDGAKSPAWHERELMATEERVAAGVERDGAGFPCRSCLMALGGESFTIGRTVES